MRHRDRMWNFYGDLAAVPARERRLRQYIGAPGRVEAFALDSDLSDRIDTTRKDRVFGFARYPCSFFFRFATGGIVRDLREPVPIPPVLAHCLQFSAKLSITGFHSYGCAKVSQLQAPLS